MWLLAAALALSAAALVGAQPALADDLPQSLPGQSSIDQLNCFDGSVAKWRKEAVTFRIINDPGISPEVVAQARAGVLEWNNIGAPQKLINVAGDQADITILVTTQPAPPGLLGLTFTLCLAGSEGIRAAFILVFLPNIVAESAGVFGHGQWPVITRNVAAHEVGHALGLGHTDDGRDLLGPEANLPAFTRNICPSNLDVGALRSQNDPYRLPSATLVELPC